MKNAVYYKGMWLQKNSVAYALYMAEDFQRLDKHLKEVNATYDKLTK